MATKITRDIIESYLHCKYKGHLQLTGQQGARSDYELLLAESRDTLRRQATDTILARHQAEEVKRELVLTRAALGQGATFLLNARLEDEHVLLTFDGLKRVPGASKLGDFHYVPVLFCECQQVRKQHRSLLEVYGLLLGRLQGRAPSNGLVWHGKECRTTRVRLNPDPRKTDRLLDELRRMQTAETLPRLILNDHCAVCEFRQRCLQQAIQEDNISLLRGMKEKEIKAYARKGVFTVTQLAYTFRPRRKGRRAPSRSFRHSHALQALAVRDKKVYVFGTPQLPTSPVRVYLDVEGNPEEGFDYLVGMIVVAGGQEQRYSFWADSREQESDVFEQFLAVVSCHDDCLVFAYGGYERAFLKRMRKLAKKKGPVDRVLKSLVNVLALIYAHIYFPTYSNGLKDVGAYLGCSWSETNASGIQSIVWRATWEATRDEQWKQKLMTYNLEDCVALKQVTEFIGSRCLGAQSPMIASGNNEVSPPVAHVRDTDQPEATYKWGHTRFFHEDFDYINKCSHFDYQRDRVYVRTSRKIKKRQARKQRNRRLPVWRRVEIAPGKCPNCKCEEVMLVPRDNHTEVIHTRRAFDLIITAGKIRRRVIECHGSFYQCARCGHQFLPSRYERLDKHFHGLKSWVMYGHVEHRLSLKVLQGLLMESFGLHVHSGEIHMFKALLAYYYRTTYKSLLKKIVTGEVLYADETEVGLKSGKGYVWVFATLEEVIYMYRPTREGDFLKELLKDFHGVLVSDFYAAYDAINCPQQKCLIHLMRDMNQDLVGNPYDDELKTLTAPFGTLLREIVVAIDQHGLRRRFLRRYQGNVARYFEFVEAQSFHSEAAESLRGRLLKYRHKLFTFLDHDGVSWNNNSSEHAIKRFACYRKDVAGSLEEPGLRDYLTLLSICHTCRMRGVSFLQFLLSRLRDLEQFGRRTRTRSRRQDVEVYPTRFMPTRLAGLEKLRTRKKTLDRARDDSEPDKQS